MFTIADKKLDLTGDAINRLLLWYVVGGSAKSANALQKFEEMKEQMKDPKFASFVDLNKHYDFSVDENGEPVNAEHKEQQETPFETIQREFSDNNIVGGFP